MSKSKFKLPDIKIQNTLGIRLVNKSISITSMLILVFIITALIIVNMYVIDITVEGSGILEPDGIKRVYCEESGILKETFITTGSSVEPGQLLALFDTLSIYNRFQKLQTQLKELKLNKQELESKIPLDNQKFVNLLDEAKNGIIEADLTMREKLVEFYPGEKRDSILNDYKIGNHISMDKAYVRKLKAETVLKNAKLEFERNKLVKFDLNRIAIKIEDLENELDYLEKLLKCNKVIASSEGKILTEEINKMPGRTFSKGQLLFEYSQMDSWIVTVDIPEIEIHNISIGDSVKLEINALNLDNENKLYGGFVSYVAIDNSTGDPQIPQNNLYKVKITLDKKGMDEEEIIKLRRGYTAKVNVITESGTIGKLLIKYFRKLL
ncbi:MAG: HlyD family secretion protein [Rhodothermaceae bacterium]